MAAPSPEWVVSPSDGWSAPKGWTPDGRPLGSESDRLIGFLLDGLVLAVPQLIVLVGGLVVTFALTADDWDAESTEGPPAGFFAGILLMYGAIFLVSIVLTAIQAELLYRRGQTPGMRWRHLRLVDAKNGQSVSRGKAWARTIFASMISGQVAGLGYWWAFFDSRNRTLHDLVVGTVVIKEGP